MQASSGVAGGYAFRAGRELPPLLLDDEEARAVAIALRTATAVGGVEEPALRALATTRKPPASSWRTNSRPKPVEQPVTNHTGAEFWERVSDTESSWESHRPGWQARQPELHSYERSRNF